MQLYKSRGFGEYFGDTFTFLRHHGKHFFKQYFIVTGIFLLILLVLAYFASKFYREFFNSMLGGGFATSNQLAFEDYMNENAFLIGIFVFAFITIGLVAAIISYAYPPIYLKLYNEHSGSHFNTQDIVSVYKKKVGTLIVFLLASIFTGFLLMIPIAIVGGILILTFIGVLLVPILIGIVMLLYSGTLIEYLEGKKGFFECFGYSWKLITTKFWASVGCVGLFYLMGSIVQQIVTIIPYIFGVASMFVDIDTAESVDKANIVNSVMILMLVIFILSFIVGIFINNIIQLNQGIVFYSLKEENENINTKSDIDLIGSSE